MLDLDAIRHAARRLEGVAYHTPVITSRTLDSLCGEGTRVFLKAESFQRAGAFKFRGAYNAIAALAPAQRERGIVTWSSGNHAQAVALAARLHATTATILMPTDAPIAKVAATREYGAEIVFYDRYTEDREALASRLAERHALTPIPAYDHWNVMAGQGTVALELIEEVGALDVLLVCVSGGGLIAGCSTAAKALCPDVLVYGVEPTAGNDTQLSLERGERVRIPVPRTIADGQQVEMPGRLTFTVNQRTVDGILLVSDAEIAEAMRFLFERLKLVIEPSGASAFAALLSEPRRFAGRRIGITLSGGNVGVARFCSILHEFAGARDVVR